MLNSSARIGSWSGASEVSKSSMRDRRIEFCNFALWQGARTEAEETFGDECRGGNKRRGSG